MPAHTHDHTTMLYITDATLVCGLFVASTDSGVALWILTIIWFLQIYFSDPFGQCFI